MTSSYAAILAKVRASADGFCAVGYEKRYEGWKIPSPVELSKRWRAALYVEPLDWSELAAIREEVCKKRAESVS